MSLKGDLWHYLTFGLALGFVVATTSLPSQSLRYTVPFMATPKPLRGELAYAVMGDKETALLKCESRHWVIFSNIPCTVHVFTYLGNDSSFSGYSFPVKSH